MAQLASWPSVIDDSGNKTSGTIFNKALTDAVKASVEDNLHPAGTASAIKAKETIQEVYDARGSTGSLSARLATALDAAGNLILPATTATITNVNGGLGAINLMTNGDFLVWGAGDALAPTGYTLSGSGTPAVARSGTGLGDTTRKVNDFAVKLTRGGAAVDDTILSRQEVNATMMARMDFMKGVNYFALGCWVKASSSNQAKIVLNDGVTLTSSAFHSGSGNWEWLTVPATLLGAAAASVQAQMRVANSNGTAYFSGLTLMMLDSGLTIPKWSPGPMVRQAYTSSAVRIGNLAANDELAAVRPVNVGLLVNARAWIRPASGATQTQIRPQNDNGAGAQDIYAAPYLSISNGNDWTTKAPDGTYQWRCMVPGFEVDAANPTSGSVIRAFIQQIQAATVVDASVTYDVLEYQSPLVTFLR